MTSQDPFARAVREVAKLHEGVGTLTPEALSSFLKDVDIGYSRLPQDMGPGDGGASIAEIRNYADWHSGIVSKFFRSDAVYHANAVLEVEADRLLNNN